MIPIGDKLFMPSSFFLWCLCGSYIIWERKVAFQVALYKMLYFIRNAGGQESPLMIEGVGGVD